jgi:hypothetical protein
LTAVVDITVEGRIRVTHEAQGTGKFWKYKTDVGSVVQDINGISHDLQALLEFFWDSRGGHLR